MDDSERLDLAMATTNLKRRLDPSSKMLAAQDFRRASQGRNESVADYIRRLERMFRQAYGREGMSAETRAALLFGQMQEGLKFELMESPAVSAATDYKQLCLSARNEEKRLAELQRRRHSMRMPAGPQPVPTPTKLHKLSITPCRAGTVVCLGV